MFKLSILGQASRGLLRWLSDAEIASRQKKGSAMPKVAGSNGEALMSEQTSPDLTSPNQRTGPRTAECVLRLGNCPHQLDYGRVPGFERFPVVCGKRGMTREWKPDTGIEYEGVQCLYSILHY